MRIELFGFLKRELDQIQHWIFFIAKAWYFKLWSFSSRKFQMEHPPHSKSSALSIRRTKVMKRSGFDFYLFVSLDVYDYYSN